MGQALTAMTLDLRTFVCFYGYR